MLETNAKKNTIKNIVFDFGDIFIDLDKLASMRLIHEEFPEFTLNQDIINTNNEYEKGIISTTNFIESYKKSLPNISDERLKDIWNAIILKIPTHRLAFIEELSQKGNYELFLLSNTNELHIEQVIKNNGLKSYHRFKNCFNKFYLSHEIKFRKPNRDIFEFVLNDNNIIPGETLFIDDTLEHINTAKQMGFHTWNLIPGKEDITELFSKDYPFKD
ncbi:HAD family hydrolase [Galbibacter sp. BG1]